MIEINAKCKQNGTRNRMKFISSGPTFARTLFRVVSLTSVEEVKMICHVPKTVLTRIAAVLLIYVLANTLTAADSGVAVLLVDTDRIAGQIDQRIYGHFLEHINHSVVDGLYAEQIRGQGFEGKDFDDYWEKFSERGGVEAVAVRFEQGERSVRIAATQGVAGLRQGRIYLQAGQTYDGSV